MTSAARCNVAFECCNGRNFHLLLFPELERGRRSGSHRRREAARQLDPRNSGLEKTKTTTAGATNVNDATSRTAAGKRQEEAMQMADYGNNQRKGNTANKVY